MLRSWLWLLSGVWSVAFNFPLLVYPWTDTSDIALDFINLLMPHKVSFIHWVGEKKPCNQGVCAIILLVLEHPLWVLWHWMNPIIKSWPYPDGVNCSRKGTMSSISQRKRDCQVFFRAGWCNKREGSSTLKVRKISWLGKDMSIQRTLCIIPALGSGFHTFVSKVSKQWPAEARCGAMMVIRLLCLCEVWTFKMVAVS